MAKKKITGQSKLASTNSPENSTESLRLVSRKSHLKPTSFRLNPEDKERLKSIAAAVNDLSPNKKISETIIIRALLLQGQKTKADRLLTTIREVIF